jgi:aminopeptidase N
MLRLRLGDAAFFQLLRTYFSTYIHGNTITSDFQDLAEVLADKILANF